ncbi:molecular chaperone DnaJ [Streptomyces sp. NPDC008079]|uniref:molecular chaperone DnaJ n=1 Tax=Streptomyces sp. NPDC008079 TaxID=3364806 RepID=UPI0036E815DE
MTATTNPLGDPAGDRTNGPTRGASRGPLGDTGNDPAGAHIRTFEDALAALDADFPADAHDAVRRYRRLARLLHPDAAPPGRTAEAAAAFARLSARHHHTDERATAPTVTTADRRYVLGPVLATGDLAVLRTAHYDENGDRREALLKIPQRPRDNDLLEHEADVLRRLDTVGERRHRAYAPQLIESFRHRDTDGVERHVNALVPLTGFHTLAEVAAAHPGGLDPRDAAWMWRRLLTALGWAHRARLVHGAVFPEHVLIHPELHGLVLVDWCYATAFDTHVPVLVDRHRDAYPPEVPERRPASPATDIHLAALCVRQLMGDRAPAPMRAFLRACVLPSQNARPQDAWQLLGELDDLLERLYGPRTFRPFAMPHI